MQYEKHSIHRVSSLTGASVFGENGESLAKVKELMVDGKSGRIAYAVLAVESSKPGGATRLFAVPWEALEVMTMKTVLH